MVGRTEYEMNIPKQAQSATLPPRFGETLQRRLQTWSQQIISRMRIRNEPVVHRAGCQTVRHRKHKVIHIRFKRMTLGGALQGVHGRQYVPLTQST